MLTRRDFLKKAGAIAAVVAVAPPLLAMSTDEPKATVAEIAGGRVVISASGDVQVLKGAFRDGVDIHAGGDVSMYGCYIESQGGGTAIRAGHPITS